MDPALVQEKKNFLKRAMAVPVVEKKKDASVKSAVRPKKKKKSKLKPKPQQPVG